MAFNVKQYMPLNNFFNIDTFPKFILHLAIYLVVLSAGLMIYFQVYLPISTRHGESVTVPNLQGMSLVEVEEFLGSRNLRFEVNDSSFNLDKKPLTILSQYPKAGAIVKEDRKIYLSINSQVPPEVKMPKLIDNSLKSAEMTLKSFGLLPGNIIYRKDLAQNAILDQMIDGKSVKPGTWVKKGTKIDLVVGDGLGETEFEIPNLDGMDIDDAEVLLIGQGLRIGIILYDENANQNLKGKVVRQIPAPGNGRKIRMGETIDLWIGGTDPAKQFSDEEPVE